MSAELQSLPRGYCSLSGHLSPHSSFQQSVKLCSGGLACFLVNCLESLVARGPGA